MFRRLFGVLATTWRLLRRLRVSGLRGLLTTAAMLMAGALEGATVGMLVPLLSMLTGKDGGSGVGVVYQVLPFLTHLDRIDQVLVMALVIWLLVVAKNLIAYQAVASAGVLRASALVEMRQQLLERVMRAPPATLDTHTSGEIANVFLNEATRVNRAMDFAVALIQRTTTALAYLGAVVMLAWRLTLVTIVLGLVLGATSYVLSRRALRHGREVTEANARLGRYVAETVGGLRVVRTTASEDAQAQGFRKLNSEQAKAESHAALFMSTLSGSLESLGVAGAMCLTALAYRTWLAPGAMDVSRFLAFSFGLLRLLPAINQVYGMCGALSGLSGSIEKVLQWLDLPGYPKRPFGSRPLGEIRSGVTFEDLTFEYTAGRPVLCGLSFHLPAGDTLAVLGPSGSGKSTLASLLLRLREPSSGHIRIDEVDYWDFEPQSFHRAVAFVEQEPFLFNVSVADNVAFGAPWVKREDVERAIRLVKLEQWAKALPQGLDTIVGERGATVSGGQRQRLAIARAVVRDPRLLILDEPTSALDADTESEVVEAMAAASAGRTTIIITHRPSTVERANRTLRLREGRMESLEKRPVAQVASG